ncbi:MAG: response regulator [Pseudomonadota bacterium]
MSDSLSILHIEDDFADAMLLQQAVCDAGAFDLELEVARTLSDAKVKLAKRTYDLIVLDLRLPDSVSPEQTMSHARQWSKGTPILVLTGSAKVDAELFGGEVQILDKNEWFAGKTPEAHSALLQRLREAAEDTLLI